MELKKLMEHISVIPDYRQAWKVEHKLSDILLLTICAVISGAEGWEDIEDFGETHLDFLKQYGDFDNGIPVHDTIARVVSCISPAKFHECFINWMRDCHSSDDKDVIAIDGKTLRHSYDKSRRRGAIHVISAFSTMHSLVIGQIRTDEKSNEITAIPELINMLDIKGKIITTDAMGCQKDIAEKIQKQGGDYLFAVKGNQGRLNKAFEEKFLLKELNNPEHDSYAISEKSHGREEIRLHIVCDVPDELTPTVITEPDGTVEISVTSQTAGTSTVTASINSSSLSRTVTFIADVRTAQIADLVVTRDNSVADGAMANMLRARVTDAFGNALAGQTVSVMADNGATTASTVTTQPDGTVEISVTSQTAGTSVVTASINNSSQSQNVTFIADVSTAQIASLEVTQDNSVADGAMVDVLKLPAPTL